MEEFALEPGETITTTARKHWVVFLLELLPFAFMALLPFLFSWSLAYFASIFPHLDALMPEDATFANPLVRYGVGLWWLAAWCGAFNTFTNYYLDLWVVTSTRIVDIHQVGFFRREVASFLLEHVQDVTTEVYGIFPTLFGFGTLRVETAGEESRHFLMRGLRHPEAMRDLIMREIAALHGQGKEWGSV